MSPMPIGEERQTSPRRYIQTRARRMSLRNQATSLALMHAVEVVQPLLILPYAAKVFGPSAYGEYAYVMSIGQLSTTLVGYGFYWTAQRAAAVARQDANAIASVV